MATVRFYQVGGAVRDSFFNPPRRSKDLDYAVEAASYEAMREAVLAQGGEIFLETPEYLTIRARNATGAAADYVLCRQDGAYYDGRRPESVVPGTIWQDLARRDFTMNAIAIAEDGTILDPYNGRKAIRQRLIACVGSPQKRFEEDGLRILRALRFSITLGFRITTVVQECMDGQLLYGVSPDRMREELDKAFSVNTLQTLYALDRYPSVREVVFSHIGLRPTLAERYLRNG